MKICIFVLSLAVSVPSFAFEYHGIKSGMSREEVSDALSKMGVNQDRFNQVNLRSGNSKNLLGVAYSPLIIDFQYNHENKLYKIQLDYELDESSLKSAAFIKALESKFKVTVASPRTGYASIVFIDEEIIIKSIEYYKIIYMKGL